MKKFKAVPGKGIVASTNTNKKRRPITASSTSDEQMFQKYHNEFINEYENGDAVSDEADIWIEETLMSAVMTAAENAYGADGIEFFAEPSGQGGRGEDFVTLTYPDGSTEDFTINLQDEYQMAADCIRDANSFKECVNMLADALYLDR